MRPVHVHSVAVLALALGALGAGSASASPSPTSRSAAASLCSVSKAVATDLAHSTSISPTSTPAGLKRVYGKLESAKPALIGAASGSLKTDMRKVFGFVDLANTDLEKVNWQISQLVPYVPALLAK